MNTEPSIAVLIPCYNEEMAVGAVVEEARRHIPNAKIYVFDNASTDDTVRVASEAGAIVRTERLRGKGNVVRRMFADVEADIYVLIDGDGTYAISDAPAMIETLVNDNLDMVTGARVSKEQGVYRPGHHFGNRFITGLVSLVFGGQFSDMLSGFRVFSRRFVKSFPAQAKGFEIETEMTIHALQLRMPVMDFPSDYGLRAEGTVSKLSTYRDGATIIFTIALLLKDERPLAFFSICALAIGLAAAGVAIPLMIGPFVETGFAPRLPMVMLVTGMTIVAFTLLTVGLILDSVARGRQEVKRVAYLSSESQWMREVRSRADRCFALDKIDEKGKA